MKNLISAATDTITDEITDAVTGSGFDGSTDIISPVQALVIGFTGVIGLVAIIAIILGAVQMQTSQGDTGKVKKAKDTIMYGIIGLVVAVLAFAIVNFILGSIL